MAFTGRLILFLIVNFGALAIGGALQGEGPGGEWYQALDQAPWTPPGMVFGIAWTLIMICFSVYMAFLTEGGLKPKVLWLFALQFVLNVSWNPIYFSLHNIAMALVVIISLLVVITVILMRYHRSMNWKSLLIMPYFIWLLIATSLNFYSLLYN